MQSSWANFPPTSNKTEIIERSHSHLGSAPLIFKWRQFMKKPPHALARPISERATGDFSKNARQYFESTLCGSHSLFCDWICQEINLISERRRLIVSVEQPEKHRFPHDQPPNQRPVPVPAFLYEFHAARRARGRARTGTAGCAPAPSTSAAAPPSPHGSMVLPTVANEHPRYCSAARTEMTGCPNRWPSIHPPSLLQTNSRRSPSHGWRMVVIRRSPRRLRRPSARPPGAPAVRAATARARRPGTSVAAARTCPPASGPPAQ